MKKILPLLLVLTFACGGEKADQEKVSRNDTIRIGTEGAYPPFNYIDANGDLQGFEIDLARELCRAMQKKCEFVAQDWDGIIPALEAGKYDVIMAAMSITEERKKRVDFTNKYLNTPARFVARRGSSFEISTAGLKGKNTGAQRSTTHANYLQDVYGSVANVKLYDTQEAANLDLVNGRLDLLLSDSIPLYEWMKKKPGVDFEFVGPPINDPRWFGEGIGGAVRKGETELVRLFNEAIEEIRKDGSYTKINAKYFPFDVYGN